MQAVPASRSVVIAVQTGESVVPEHCPVDDWSDAAEAAARLLPVPVEVTDYTFRLFVMPEAAGNGACNFGGGRRGRSTCGAVPAHGCIVGAG